MAAKVADVFYGIGFAIALFCCFCVSKPRFIQPDGISNTLNATDYYEERTEDFVCSSLYVCKQKLCHTSKSRRHKILLTVLLLLCGDVESCPGPQNLSDYCSRRGLKFVHQNVRGLLKNFDLLEALVHKLDSKLDIISVSETHIVDGDASDNEELYVLPGYTLVKRNRKSGKGGGVAIFIKNSVNFKRRIDLENSHLESIWLEIFIKNSKSILIGCFYRPPEGSKYLPSNYNELLNDHLTDIAQQNKETMLLGDFNVNYSVRNDNKEFKSIMNTYGFKQLINKATRTADTSSTIIDLLFTNCPHNINYADVFVTSISDHDMIGGVRKINNVKIPMRTVKCRNYGKYNPDKLCEDVGTIDWEPVYASHDVNAATKHFTTELKNVFDQHAPLIEKRVKDRQCKWLTTEIKREMNKRDMLHRKAQKSRKLNDKVMYKKARNSCNNKIRKAKATYHRELINENLTNPKKFWKAIKAVFPTKSKIVNTLSPKTDSKSAVEKFSYFFKTVVSSLKSKSIPLMDFTWSFITPFNPRTKATFKVEYVSKLFVEKELRKLKRDKATGIDDLPPGMLKDCALLISKPLCHIINLSIKTSTVPTIWKVAKITPTFKSGNSSLPENYRPISVLPVLSKILEKAMHNELINYLEQENLLNDCQYGFRSKRSTKLASTLFCDNIRREMDGGKLVGAIYIDLSKAFDTIGHALLLKKLQSYGVHGNELTWFTDYLFNRSQLVDMNNVCSDYEPNLRMN